MMLRLVTALAFTMAMPAVAEDTSDIFTAGNVMCSNYDALNKTCRTITTITKREGDIRFSSSRRKVALPNDQVLMETAGASRVEGLKSCGLYPTAKPRITPFNNKYMEALITVHERKRDYRLARGICVEYRPCGTAYQVYRMHVGLSEPKLISLTTVFDKDDPRISQLKLRRRTFGVIDPIPTECEPTG